MIKKLFPYFEKYKVTTFFAIFMTALEVIMEIAIPLLMAQIVDIGIRQSDMNYIFKMGVIMIAMSLMALFFGALAGRLEAVSAVGFADEVRKTLFARIQNFSFANVEKFGTPSLITRATTDVTNLEVAFSTCLKMLVKAPLLIIISSVIAAMISPNLALIFFIALPIVIILLSIIAAKAFPKFQMMLKKYDRLNSAVQEVLIAIRAVKSLVRHDFENEKFDDSAKTLEETRISAERVIAFSTPSMQFVMYSAMIAILWFGGKMIIGESLLTGDLMSFFTYLSQILSALTMLTTVLVMIVICRASVKRIIEVLDEIPDVRPPKAPGIRNVDDGSIVFKNVSFSYGGENANLALSDINLEIKSGETIGIIGGTGSSKSTLVKLLPRLYDASFGTIYIGGENIREYSLKTLRESVALVLQVNLLFRGTIKENVKWGNPDASDEEVIKACKIVQAHNFITEFPDGYDTLLKHEGVNLSGGQKQRICIARALLKRPRILILDDATSAVDTATDTKIRRAFKETMQEITIITVAQRVSSIIDSDRIIVMDDGKINAVGTHEELLESNAIYSQIYKSQQTGGVK